MARGFAKALASVVLALVALVAVGEQETLYQEIDLAMPAQDGTMMRRELGAGIEGQMLYAVNDEGNGVRSLSVRIDIRRSVGWVGFAISPQYQMLGSHAVLGLIPAYQPTYDRVGEYKIQARDVSGIVPYEGESGLLEASFMIQHGWMTLQFKATSIAGRAINFDGSDLIAIAVGPTWTLGKHYTKGLGHIYWDPKNGEPTKRPTASPTVTTEQPTSSPVEAPPPSDDDITGQDVINGATVSWTIPGGQNTKMQISVSVPGNPDWVGLGIGVLNGAAVRMVGGRAVIGLAEDSIDQYELGGKDTSVVTVANTNSLEGATLSTVGGNRVLTFTTDGIAGTNFNLDGTDPIIVAWGSDNNGALKAHVPSKRGGKVLRWKEVVGTLAPSSSPTWRPTKAPVVAPKVTDGELSVLDNKGVLKWTELSNSKFAFTLEYEAAQGWLAMGVSRDGGMLGANVVIGEGSNVGEFNLDSSAKIKPGAAQAYNGLSDVTDPSFTKANGKLILAFSATAIAGQKLNVAEFDTWVFAAGSQDAFGYHGGEDFNRQANVQIKLITEEDEEPIAEEPAVRPNELRLLNNVASLQWALVGEDEVEITFKHPVAENGQGWLAVGLSDTGKMPTGRVVIGVNEEANRDRAGVAEYKLSGKSLGAIEPYPEGAIRDASFTVQDGEMILTFTAAAIAGQPINRAGTDTLIVAVGGEDEFRAAHAFRQENIPMEWGKAGNTDDTGDDDNGDDDADDAEEAAGEITLLDGASKLSFEVLADDSVKMTLVHETEVGYLAVGLSDDGKMIGSTAVIGVVGGEVDVYNLLGKAGAGATESIGAADLIDASFAVEGGKTILTFTAKGLGNKVFDTEGENTLVMAFGNEAAVVVHTGRVPAITINLKAGADAGGVAEDNKAAVITAHAVMMALGFLYFMPLAAVPSALRETLGLNKGQPATWYLIHRGVQLTTCTMVIVAFFLAVSTQDVHFDTPHKALGLVIILLAATQPVLALYCRKGKYRPVWLASHLIFAAFMILGGVAECMMGAAAARGIVPDATADGLQYMVFAGAAIVGIATIIVTANRVNKHCLSKPEPQPEVQDSGHPARSVGGKPMAVGAPLGVEEMI